MSDPLTLLQKYHVDNNTEQVLKTDEHIVFKDLAWPKDTKTSFKIHGSKKDGKWDHYSLECLYFFAKNIKKPHSEYVEEASREKVPLVFDGPDRRDLIGYLEGSISIENLESIDKNLPIQPPSSLECQSMDVCEKSKLNLTPQSAGQKMNADKLTPGHHGRLTDLNNADPDSPTTMLASLLTSPSTLLKRPFQIMSTTDNVPFQIKRRKCIIDKPLSLNDVVEVNENSGASPSLATSVNPGGTPLRKSKAFPGYSALRKHPALAERQPNKFVKPTLRRAFSENAATLIKRSFSLEETNENLTGDFNQSMSLPLLKTGLKHQDLKTIDCHTLAKLINGDFSDKVAQYRIIDARYCYEYQGGHILGAENFGSWEAKNFFDEFLPGNVPVDVDPVLTLKTLGEKYLCEDKKRSILIFHCEFSSARGPALMKELRNKDREVNKESYPALHYPECYLLHNGYKEFFQNYPHLCEPQAYRTMIDPNFSNEERQFRKKAKSWAVGATVSRTGAVSRKYRRI